MSPIFVNDNAHPVRVSEPNELTGAPQLRRLVPGAVVEADGKYADNLEATPGVREGSESELEKYRESRLAKGTGLGTRLRSKLAIGPFRTALRHVTVAAPLRRVVGDDAAPHGPRSGVITTKAEAARVSPVERQAFADHERLPEERIEHAGEPSPLLPSSVVPTSEEIENAQAANAAVAEEYAEEFIEGYTGSSDAELGLAEKTSGEAQEPAEGARLTGDKLDARAEELEIDTSTGGSNNDGSLNADEKREAIAAKEAELEESGSEGDGDGEKSESS